MGYERLLCGALERYSRLFRLGNFQQEARAFQNATQSNGESTRLFTWFGLNGEILAPTARQVAARRGYCSSTQPAKDVTLFEHDRTRFFRVLTVFCGGQFVFWTYLAQFAFTGLRDTGGKGRVKAPTTTTGLAGMWSFEMNLGSNAWRYGFTLGCLTIGAGIVGLGALFCLRSVSKVVLHKGGRMVTVRTQSPLGPDRGRTINVPLNQVACHAHRQESPSFIPLRIKGHRLYFLLDKDGTVNNARLFDVTVGAYRPF
ncbi:transmembrane protein 223 [Poecilia reticulata]|uniref:transmembrane protein 223 n=1 Tax=Poecilia reticulata TaxID=8081 RepID=UPI0004A25FC9|nr:PREDICTED: transmembrane protein 223 [Poecilia reticulata]